jgi:hypothetical protein
MSELMIDGGQHIKYQKSEGGDALLKKPMVIAQRWRLAILV